MPQGSNLHQHDIDMCGYIQLLLFSIIITDVYVSVFCMVFESISTCECFVWCLNLFQRFIHTDIL